MSENGFQSKQHSGLKWIVLNTFGWGIFILCAVPIGLLAWEISQNSRIGHDLILNKWANVIIASIAGCLWGAILGKLQKSLLRRHFNLDVAHWILATMIGLMLYAAFQVSHQYLLMLVESPGENPSNSLIMFLLELAFYFIPPLLLGIAQWSVLRSYFEGSGWWLAAVILGVGCAGWAFSEIIKISIANGGHYFMTSFSIAVFLLEGLAYGITTWFALVFFTNQLVVTNSSASQ
jgi:hypothetical protein